MTRDRPEVELSGELGMELEMSKLNLMSKKGESVVSLFRFYPVTLYAMADSGYDDAVVEPFCPLIQCLLLPSHPKPITTNVFSLFCSSSTFIRHAQQPAPRFNHTLRSCFPNISQCYRAQSVFFLES